MRRLSTDKKTSRQKKRAIQLVASVLTVTASLAGANAVADHKGYNDDYQDIVYRQDRYRYGPIYWNHQQKVRVKIPVRDHGPEALPLGRLIRLNSNIDPDRYRLVAVVTKNGRFSSGYASLRTGTHKTQHYFLGSHEKTLIPAPSRTDGRWWLRLGPGTQVRSVTAVLEPRHGWAYRQPAHRRHVPVRDHSYQPAQDAPWLSLAWMLVNADDDDRDHRQSKRLHTLRAEKARTKAELAEARRKLDRTRERNKRLKDQRARLAEELAHDRVETHPGKRGKADDRRGTPGGERVKERKGKRTVRYLTSAS